MEFLTRRVGAHAVLNDEEERGRNVT